MKDASVCTLTEMQEMDKTIRNQAIRRVKELEKIPARQIARITGIS